MSGAAHLRQIIIPAPEATARFKLIAAPLQAFERLVSRVHVQGVANIPKNGPVIVVANHTVHIDAITLGSAIYRAGRQPCFVAGSDFFDSPVLGDVLHAVGAVPAYREGPKTKDSLNGFSDALACGKVLVIFPEGTFTRDPQLWPMRGKTGIARLHLQYPEIPIIPVAHWGNEALIDPWTARPNFRALISRARLDVVIGKPLRIQIPQGDEYAQLTAITAQVMQGIEDLLVPLRRNNPCGYTITPRQSRWDVKLDGDPNAERDTLNRRRRAERNAAWTRLAHRRTIND